MNQMNRSTKGWTTEALNLLRYYPESAQIHRKYLCLEEEENQFVNLLTTTFATLLDTWPFHLHESEEQGRTKYCLFHLEKECLQSLGLQNFLSTSWP
jgi:hypothetical protein